VRIRRISIDGYGRLTGQAHEFAPGLQVVVGPNERGKSTMRAFIGDMLFGQRRHPGEPVYDEARDFRAPWGDPERYGGALVYELDTGRQVEVTRGFAPGRESVRVYDRTEGRDVTEEFELLRNGEPDFAGAHLGLSKEVFLGAATISHLTLEELAEGEALARIRERLLALADSGGEALSAENALRRLNDRMDATGRPGVRGKPLSNARIRLDEVNREYRAALEAQEAVAEIEEQRGNVLRQCAEVRTRRAALEQQLQLLEQHDRASRLAGAESLAARIDTATQHCFSLGAAVREFPLNQLPEVQRAENRVSTARVQLKRTRDELKKVRRQFEEEFRRSGALSDKAPVEIDEAAEARLGELAAAIERLRERLAEADEQVLAAQERIDAAQVQVNTFPDFSRLAPDPVAWLTQLSSSFDVAVRTRDEECERRAQLRREVAQRKERLAAAQSLFSECPDFPEKAREYDLTKRMLDEQRGRLASYLQALRNTEEEIVEKLPGFRFLSAGLGAFMLLLVAGYFYFGHAAMLLPAAFTLVAMLYFLLNLGYARRRLEKARADVQQTSQELEALDESRPQQDSPIVVMMRREGCETVRELEARYDAYRTALAELAAREEVLAAVETRAAEAEDRVARLFERFQETFRQVGEEVTGETDIKRAAGRAVTRYQEYREAKARFMDCRATLEKLQQGRRRYQSELEAMLGEQGALAATVRAAMQEDGFPDGQDYPDILAALRAWREYQSTSRERRARAQVLQEKSHDLERQVKTEELELEKCEQGLAHLLARAGVSSTEQWRSMAEQAREYREIWDKRVALQEQLDAVLRGEDIQALRGAVQTAGELPPKPRRSRDDIQADAAACAAKTEAHLREEHRLLLQIAERTAGVRSLNEIEEERAVLERQVEDLELEMEAASYALAHIQEIARDRHARIGPALAELASAYLAEITDGAYAEIRLERDFSVCVPLAAAGRVLERPEKSLSKGTIDQVYLALRLALVRAMSRNGESVPMLLDDPFANYDDARLERTMRLIARIAADNQVILFTCREDVTRAAEAVRAPVLRL